MVKLKLVAYYSERFTTRNTYTKSFITFNNSLNILISIVIYIVISPFIIKKIHFDFVILKLKMQSTDFFYKRMKSLKFFKFS